MKKITILAIVIVAATLGSCKKDYTCECTYSSGGSTLTTTATLHATKKDAKAACDNSASAGGTGWTCAIK